LQGVGAGVGAGVGMLGGVLQGVGAGVGAGVGMSGPGVGPPPGSHWHPQVRNVVLKTELSFFNPSYQFCKFS